MSKNIITGVKPTGASMHLGNLLGAILPFDQVAKGNNAAIFIADLHALTSVKNGDLLRTQSYELAIEYLAIHGLDTPITIFRQSDIVLIPRLNWILNNVTPYSLMLRAHSFKDFQQKREQLLHTIAYTKGQIDAHKEQKKLFDEEFPNPEFSAEVAKSLQEQEVENTEASRYLQEFTQNYENNLNMWVFNYPILMAADILAYETDIVPVGQDQKQHLEMTRDIARAFNKTYKEEVFRLPQEHINPSVATLPGVDGRKMSKSYDNFIGVFDDVKTLKKRIMSIVTDSLGVDDVKDPTKCNVFALISVFGTPEQVAAIRTKYETPNAWYGYGHAKLELLDILSEYLRPYRERRDALLGDSAFVEAKLQEGARIMNARIETKMKEVDRVVGF